MSDCLEQGQIRGFPECQIGGSQWGVATNRLRTQRRDGQMKQPDSARSIHESHCRTGRWARIAEGNDPPG
jgi:hypothetical protein